MNSFILRQNLKYTTQNFKYLFCKNYTDIQIYSIPFYLQSPSTSKSTIDSHPTTPTPDYDLSPANSIANTTFNNNYHPPQKQFNGHANSSHKGTMGRVAATEMAKANGDTAEMESIESFKLNNPSSPRPKPPSMYFNPQSSGPPTMKKSQRPVSVSIGEYIDRKEPNRFNFITKTDGRSNGNVEPTDNMSERLKSELEKTLSRSNLMSKNEIEVSL